MILCNEIEQHGCLFFHRRIEVNASEGLIDLSDGTLERIIFFIAKQSTAAKLLFQTHDSFHRILVSGMELKLARSLGNIQLLIVVLVKRVESISIIGNNIDQLVGILGRQPCLTQNGTS